MSGADLRLWGGGSIISMFVGVSGSMPLPQENFDFGHLKMAIWESYQLFNYIYKLHILCVQILRDTKYK